MGAIGSCAEKQGPPAAPTAPLVVKPLDAGADASRPVTKNEPLPTPLSCPTPAVVQAARACPVSGAAPSMSQILDLQLKISTNAMKVPPKKPAKPAKNDQERLAPRAFTADERDLLQLTRAFVCRMPDSEQRTEVAYSEARQYFEAQHWEEAAALFHEVAVGPPSDVAVYAAQLSLEAVHVQWRTFQQQDCFHTLEVWIDEFIARLCTPTKRGDEEQCRMLAKVKEDVARMKR
jgi:hypothetical protein